MISVTVNPPEKTEMEPIKTLPLGELKARWGGEEAANTHCWELRTQGGEAWVLGVPRGCLLDRRVERAGRLEEETNTLGPGTSGIYSRLPLVVQQLRLLTYPAKGMGSIPDWGTKIPQAKWCSQKRKGLTRFKEVELTISGEEEAPMENFRCERGLQKLENCL